MIDIIDGALFQRMIIHASASINTQKQAINELNVFPVPDGDTGTNMSLTIGTAAAEAKKKPAAAIGQAADTLLQSIDRRSYNDAMLDEIARTIKENVAKLEQE